jgi:dTDP-4-dehydrorhamnose reductase
VRWLVTGAGGMLGSDVVDLLRGRGERVTAAPRSSLDVTDPVAVGSAVAGHDIVVNCAAWTAVDDAEERESKAFDVNALGPARLARSAASVGARLVQISTDYVFDGAAEVPYPSNAPVRPRSAYGRTKTSGEWAVRAELPRNHLVVRTAWLYGARGRCFPKTIARVAAAEGVVSVVNDQIGQPTWTHDVADFVHRLVTSEVPPGTYHATSSGQASWFDFAREVCESAGLGVDVVEPTSSAEVQRPAPRPAYSVLDHRASEEAGVVAIGDWRERWRKAADGVLGLSR